MVVCHVIMDIMAQHANIDALRVVMRIFVTLLMVIAPKAAMVKSMVQCVTCPVIPTVTLATVIRTLATVPAYQDIMGKNVMGNVHQTVTTRHVKQVIVCMGVCKVFINHSVKRLVLGYAKIISVKDIQDHVIMSVHSVIMVTSVT